VEETLDTTDAANPFFGKWMATWSRKIFIAKVLDRCRCLPEGSGEPRREPLPGTGKAALERALLTIDVSPGVRCFSPSSRGSRWRIPPFY
jgi:hypothetical protein